MNNDLEWPKGDKVRVSRRQVAAIAFLANIRVEEEAEEDLPGLHCLQGTEVLENYRRSFRVRAKVPSKKTGGGQHKKDDARISTSRDREKTPEMSGEAGARPWGSLRKRSTTENKENRGVAVNKARRQLSSHCDDTGKVCSSMESVINFGDSRVRQMSGTLSENSHSSVREVVYIKSDDQAKVADERMVFISHSKVPFSVSSTIPYNKYSKTSRRYSVSRLSLRGGDRYGHDLSRRHRHQSGLALPAISDSFDAFELLGLDRTEAGQEISYSELLEPSYERKDPPQQPIESEADFIPVSELTVGALSCQGEQELGAGAWGAAVGAPYSPHLLDGWLGAGKHRTFLTFPSYITSIIEYVKPSDMKKELNEKFSERFPHAQITLSKLRSIKVEMRRIGLECSIDTVTMAQAYVYFEKLVLKNIINKVNRKFCAGASIILAAKLNDCKGDQLKMVIEKTETVFRLNRRDLLASEFAILVALEFSLHIPSQEIFPHYQRLLYQT